MPQSGSGRWRSNGGGRAGSPTPGSFALVRAVAQTLAKGLLLDRDASLVGEDQSGLVGNSHSLR
jgi:hypothetical protein